MLDSSESDAVARKGLPRAAHTDLGVVTPSPNPNRTRGHGSPQLGIYLAERSWHSAGRTPVRFGLSIDHGDGWRGLVPPSALPECSQAFIEDRA